MNSDIIKVVIADDNTFFSETLSMSLKDFGYIRVVKVINDFTALVDFCTSASFDVLVLDVNFGGINTLENISDFRADESLFKIIVLTTLENKYIKTLAHNSNINKFISKGSSFTDFAETIKDCFENQSYFKIESKENSSVIIDGVKFTDRKIEVLKMLYEYSYENDKQIAERLNISYHSLKFYKKELFEMTNTHRILDLIKFGLKNGILLQ